MVNLLFGSAISLAILMQCLSLCCNSLVFVKSISHREQQISVGLSHSLIMLKETSSLRGLPFLFLVTKGSLDKQSAASFLCPGMCCTFMFLPWSSKDHLSNLWLSVISSAMQNIFPEILHHF